MSLSWPGLIREKRQQETPKTRQGGITHFAYLRLKPLKRAEAPQD
jgi:hypothetical protein